MHENEGISVEGESLRPLSVNKVGTRHAIGCITKYFPYFYKGCLERYQCDLDILCVGRGGGLRYKGGV